MGSLNVACACSVVPWLTFFQHPGRLGQEKCLDLDQNSPQPIIRYDPITREILKRTSVGSLNHRNLRPQSLPSASGSVSVQCMGFEHHEWIGLC